MAKNRNLLHGHEKDIEIHKQKESDLVEEVARAR
jgi:hypothetical protein